MTPQTSEYGRLFEQWIILEIYRLNLYFKKDWTLSYFSTKDGLEIDLVIERPGEPFALIEIKSTQKVSADDLRHLKKIKKDLEPSELFCFSLDETERVIDGVCCLHWKQGLEGLI